MTTTIDDSRMMEIISRFNASLSTLYDEKLPVSKTKISEITRTAIQGVRVYKHIVQSVERFIHKCRPEYKLPALYVIDSIVRHSQHEFRKDRDFYGQRFARNLQKTFQNLFSTCLAEDKPKIVRVLNLWQKNNVFSPDVIQPLLDLAHPGAGASQSLLNAGISIDHSIMPTSSSLMHKYRNNDDNNRLLDHLDNRIDRLLPKNDDDSSNNGSSSGITSLRMSETSSAAIRQLAPGDDRKLVAQLQQIAVRLSQYQHNNNDSLDHFGGNRNNDIFGLSDPEMNEDDDDISTPTEAEPPYPKIKSKLRNKVNTEKKPDAFADLMKILQQQRSAETSSILMQNDPDNRKLTNDVQHHNHHHHHHENISESAQESILQKFFNSTAVAKASEAAAAAASTDNMMDENYFAYQPPPPPPPPPEQPDSPLMINPEREEIAELSKQQQSISKHSRSSPSSVSPSNIDRHQRSSHRRSKSRDQRDRSYEQRHHRTDRYRSPSRDRDREHWHSSRKRRSRSSHRNETNSNNRRSRSRSRSTGSSPSTVLQDLEREKEERERLKEKRRKGYPPMRKDCMTICSTTLWIGHLPKRTTSEMDLNDLFGVHGCINSIDLIPSRGCAYICMDRRQDAYKAFLKIKSQAKILGSSQVKLTWAPGKGMKNKEYKDYWESDIGCSFIPYAKMNDELDLDQMEEGGVIDEDTIPERFKELRKLRQQEKQAKELQQQQQVAVVDPSLVFAAQTPVVVNQLIPVAAFAQPPPPPPPPPLPTISPALLQAPLPVNAQNPTNLMPSLPPHLNASHQMPVPQPGLLAVPGPPYHQTAPQPPSHPGVFPVVAPELNHPPLPPHLHSAGFLPSRPPPPPPTMPNPWAPMPDQMPMSNVRPAILPSPLRPPPPIERFNPVHRIDHNNHGNQEIEKQLEYENDENNEEIMDKVSDERAVNSNNHEYGEEKGEAAGNKFPEMDFNYNNDEDNSGAQQNNVWEPSPPQNHRHLNMEMNNNMSNKRRRMNSRFDTGDNLDTDQNEPFHQLPPPHMHIFPNNVQVMSGGGGGPSMINRELLEPPLPPPRPLIQPNHHDHPHHFPPTGPHPPPMFNNPIEPYHHHHHHPHHPAPPPPLPPPPQSHMMGPNRFSHLHGPPPPLPPPPPRQYGNYPSPPRLFENAAPMPPLPRFNHSRPPLLSNRGPPNFHGMQPNVAGPPPPPPHRFGPPPPQNRPFWFGDQPPMVNNQRHNNFRNHNQNLNHHNGRFQNQMKRWSRDNKRHHNRNNNNYYTNDHDDYGGDDDDDEVNRPPEYSRSRNEDDYDKSMAEKMADQNYPSSPRLSSPDAQATISDQQTGSDENSTA